MNLRMDGWMERWMDGWMDEWMDGWMDDGRVNECMTLFKCRSSILGAIKQFAN